MVFTSFCGRRFDNERVLLVQTALLVDQPDIKASADVSELIESGGRRGPRSALV